MSAVVLDAAALLALLRREPGWDKVSNVLPAARIASVNLGEVADRQFRQGWSRDEFLDVIGALNLLVAPIDAALAIAAAAFRDTARKAGLSHADCLCIALALSLDATVMSADRNLIEFARTLGAHAETIR